MRAARQMDADYGAISMTRVPFTLTMRQLAFLCILFFHSATFAQQNLQDSAAHYLALIGTEELETDRLIADSIFHDLLSKALQQPGAFEAPFAQLKNMGKLASSDGKLRLFNWNVPLKDGKHLYHCLLLYKQKKEPVFFELSMPESPVKDINPRKALGAEFWYGALYYEIIPVKKGAKTYYTLLGWSGNDRLSTRKMIDVLHFSGKRVKLGAPIFEMENPQYRVVFEYSEEVRMGLGFEEEKQRIVFDHLAPIHQDLEDQFQFYGPDGSYNALVWQKSKWVLDADIAVEGESNGPFNAPKPPDPTKLKH